MSDFTKEDFQDALELAEIYVKKVKLTFEQYAKEMVDYFGDGVKPHLKEIWDTHAPKAPEMPRVSVPQETPKASIKPKTEDVPLEVRSSPQGAYTSSLNAQTSIDDRAMTSMEYIEAGRRIVTGSSSQQRPLLTGTLGVSCLGLGCSIYVLVCISPQTFLGITDGLWTLMATLILVSGVLTSVALAIRTLALLPVSMSIAVASYLTWTVKKPSTGLESLTIYLFFVACGFVLAIILIAVTWIVERRKINRNVVRNYDRGPDGFTQRGTE